MPFLDVNKKIWKIRDLEIPVIEDIPMKDLKWFKQEYKNILKKSEEGKLSQSEALEFDETWWDKLCKIGLNKTVDEVQDSKCTEKEFREFMAELYNFLANLSTIEEAKRFALYVPGTKSKESKP